MATKTEVTNQESKRLSKENIAIVRELLCKKKSEVQQAKSLYDVQIGREEKGADREQASILSDQIISLAIRDEKIISQCDTLIREIDAGNYTGCCKICNTLLSMERLRANPLARICISKECESEYKRRY